MSKTKNLLQEHKQLIESFFSQCVRHDWFYAFSDDNKVYSKGETSLNTLKQTIVLYPFLERIYKDFEDYQFGEGNKKRKPVLSNYL
jgi:hypothetical protein